MSNKNAELLELLKDEQRGLSSMVAMLMYAVKQDLSKSDLETRIKMIINEVTTPVCKVNAEVILFDMEAHNTNGLGDTPFYVE